MHVRVWLWNCPLAYSWLIVCYLGNRSPVELLHVVELLEENLGRKAIRHLVDIQPGDVRETYADIEALANAVGFSPATPIEVGIKRFVDWYREYHSHRPDTIGL